MKNIKYITSLLVAAIIFGCSTENDLFDIDTLGAPTNISALTTVTQDNTGKVTFLPRGEGVTQFSINYGDTTTDPVYVSPGSTVDHVYKEGVYNATITGTTVNGKSTEVIQKVEVAFRAPEDVTPAVASVLGDNFSITVQATAKYETFFQVYFGEVANEVPVDFMEGEVITHTYAAVGSYTIKIVALSGGVATTTTNQTVEISNPINLPITFETAIPAFGNFGGATSVSANNPSIGTLNGSDKVAKLTKSAGAEVWAGSTIELAAPIDFSTKKVIKMKVWSPKAGIVVKMKLEKLVATDATSIEKDVTTTAANTWQELSFDFTGINNANDYQRVVVFFDFGVAGSGSDFYYDDIELVTGEESLVLPISFESTNLTYAYGNFGGATTTVIANPKIEGSNTSAKVSALVKSAGSEVWAGGALDLDNSINFAIMKKIKIKVWSPKAGIIVKLKLEKKVASDATSVEVDATSTVANGWEELTFDFPTIVNANAYQRVVLFFDFGNAGTGTTYYFDDIIQSN
ncbi:hypothetical protein [Flavobacterium algicola]|uniref:hypothetical protein n=1 Tax=Flavobacterium algicola TaxID=556529 RepID=UPI001EFECFB7|nr:hypothetical protein [Flavobacterium algicola]MCG9791019.1 hypothetical protein [Flavobacterium algicola]